MPIVGLPLSERRSGLGEGGGDRWRKWEERRGGMLWSGYKIMNKFNNRKIISFRDLSGFP